VLFPKAGLEAPLGETRYTQPALFALEYALSELWRSWGVTPSIVVGHSVGEYVAACVAGVFSLEDGLALIASRAALMQALPAGGTMAAVFANEARVAPRVAGLTGRVSIAAVNGPEEIVLSGDADAIAQLLEALTAEGIKSRALNVSHAFHSARLDPMLDAFERRAFGVSYEVPRLPLVSNLTGAIFTGDDRPDAHYWRRHAREAVRFTDCIDSLRTFAASALVEVGPNPTLLGLVSRTLPNATWGTAASLRQNRDDRREMHASLGMLYTRGASVKWEAVMADRHGRRISLPTYPFQRERHWVESAPAHRESAAVVAGHPLLGPRVALAGTPATSVWQRGISLETHPWLSDHRVQGAAIFPATGYIEMAIRSGKEVLQSEALSVTDIEVQKPLILHDTRARIVQTSLTRDEDGARFAVHSRPAESSNSDGPWTAHVSARIRVIKAPASTETGRSFIEEARGRCGRELDGRRFYAALAAKGNQWGPCFQGMDHVWSGDGEAVGRVQVGPSLIRDINRYQFHPAVSDACGHSLVATVPIERSDAATGSAFVGGGVREVRFYKQPGGTTLWTHSKLTKSADAPANTITGDVAVYDESGALVSETIGARLWYLDEKSETALAGALDDLSYRVQWRSSELDGPSVRAAGAGAWIVFADSHGVAEGIARSRRSQARRTILVTPGQAFSADGDAITIRPDEPADYQKTFAAANDVSAVVHLWTSDAAASALQLVRVLLGTPFKPRPRLWLVTRGSQPVVANDRCDDPLAASLWGLGRALASEHTEMWGGLVDLPCDAGVDAAVQLVREIEAGTVEDKIAFRRGQRYVARLVRRSALARKGFRVRADGTYIVTGGLGGIGLAMARWLVDQGARHLVLIGRTPLVPRAGLDPGSLAARRHAAVDALEARGAHVEVVSADLAIEGAIDRCLDERRQAGRPPVRGVFHAAGVLQFQALASQDTASLRSMLAAKASSAWFLHRRLMNEPLDCFVMCSSTSALLNSPLLGGYAASNACLDALAWHRRALGLPALSVNWGTWGEVGMAVESGRGGDMLTGISTIATSRGLAAMQELLEEDETQAAVMPVDWAKFHHTYPMFTADPFFTELVAGLGDGDGDRSSTLTAPQLAAADPAARQTLLSTYLRTECARVLGFAADRLDPTSPLPAFGFDSLMAVQLKNRIESDLGVIVPMIQFLQGPSVDQLAQIVGEAAPAVVGPRTEALAVPWEEGSL
jgi:acyl transferase domain-containing protein